jgi:hypothetical protein
MTAKAPTITHYGFTANTTAEQGFKKEQMRVVTDGSGPHSIALRIADTGERSREGRIR